MNMNDVSSEFLPAPVKLSQLPAGVCFDTSPTPGVHGYCMMKLDDGSYISLINGHRNTDPEGYDREVWPAPVGAVVTISVGTRIK